MIIGLTGHSGSGKTTAAKIFEDLGLYHIDCDRLVHDRVYTDPRVVLALKNVFGAGVVKDGAVDRRTLGAIVFSDEDQYKKLMQTVVPFITDAILDDIRANDKRDILLDAPGLFEFGLERVCDVTVGIVTNDAISRIIARDGISEDDARRRLAHQQTPEYYISRCDRVLHNDGTVSELDAAIRETFNKLMKGERF